MKPIPIPSGEEEAVLARMSLGVFNSVFMAGVYGRPAPPSSPEGRIFRSPERGRAGLWQNPGFEGGVLLRRVGIFGWGVVAPRSPNIDAFAANLASAESWLQPFNGFGPDNFLVGVPEFRFADYRDWIASRFPPARFHQLEEKMDLPVHLRHRRLHPGPGAEPGAGGGAEGARHRRPRLHGHRARLRRRRSREQHPGPRPGAAALGPLLGRAQPGVPGTGGAREPAGAAARSRDGRRPRGPLRGRGRLVAPLGRRLAGAPSNTCASWPRSRGSTSEGDIEQEQGERDEGEAAPPALPAGEVEDADAPLAVGVVQPGVEHLEHAGGADLDDGAHHRPRLRAGRRLLDLRRLPEAGDGRHPPRRGQGGGDGGDRSAAARAVGGRLLLARG